MPLPKRVQISSPATRSNTLAPQRHPSTGTPPRTHIHAGRPGRRSIMNRIKKALAGSGAAALIAGTAMVGLTATPAEAHPLDCWWLEQQATAAFNTSQYYHN